jgi:hypothetical protein
MHERVFDRFGIVPIYMCDWPVSTACDGEVLQRLRPRAPVGLAAVCRASHTLEFLTLLRGGWFRDQIDGQFASLAQSRGIVGGVQSVPQMYAHDRGLKRRMLG